MVIIKNVWDAAHEKNLFQERSAPKIFKEVRFKKGMKVLDIGCGNCKHLSYLRKKYNVRCYGVDISKIALSKNTDKKIKTYHASATRLPFKNNTFDFVYSLGTIEHTNTQKALRESARVLKKDGMAIHTVPNSYSIWTIIRPLKKLAGRWQLGLEQSFSPNKLNEMFLAAGFRDITWSTIGFENYSGSVLTGWIKRIDDFFQKILSFYGFFLQMRGVKR